RVRGRAAAPDRRDRPRRPLPVRRDPRRGGGGRRTRRPPPRDLRPRRLPARAADGTALVLRAGLPLEPAHGAAHARARGRRQLHRSARRPPDAGLHPGRHAVDARGPLPQAPRARQLAHRPLTASAPRTPRARRRAPGLPPGSVGPSAVGTDTLRRIPMTTAPRTRRVIIDTDAKNEADDQFAIVHALLSETLDVRGLIAAHFGTSRSDTSMLDSRAEIDLLLEHLDRRDVRVENGAADPLPDETTPADSPGARLIVEEARKEGEGPLQIAFLGPLTDMAAALLLDPGIVETDTTVIWIGGPGYDGREVGDRSEVNLRNDIAAANVVFRSGIEIWQVPRSAYVMTSVGYAELEEKVRPCGDLGAYLVD